MAISHQITDHKSIPSEQENFAFSFILAATDTGDATGGNIEFYHHLADTFGNYYYCITDFRCYADNAAALFELFTRQYYWSNFFPAGLNLDITLCAGTTLAAGYGLNTRDYMSPQYLGYPRKVGSYNGTILIRTPNVNGQSHNIIITGIALHNPEPIISISRSFTYHY